MNVLSGLPFEELTDILSPLPRFRAVQIFKWIAADVSSFDAMGNLPLELRKELAERFTLRPPAAITEQQAADGTTKLAIQFGGVKIEAVLLCDRTKLRGTAARYTACLSTQVGCPAGCVFCKTGTNFARNLDSAEIVEQFLRLRAMTAEAEAAALGAAAASSAALSIANIVVMGMGEPLLNLPELRRALNVITSREGINFSRRRITVSTCGIAEGIAELADNPIGKSHGVRLALSLTTADEDLRRRLMPITAGQPLAKVKKALASFQERGGGRVTLEAVLLRAINTRSEDAASIAQFARDLDVVVNLIPWNPVPGLEFEGRPLQEPTTAEVASFAKQLEAQGLNVTRRYRRGRGVAGACGQLGNK